MNTKDTKYEGYQRCKDTGVLIMLSTFAYILVYKWDQIGFWFEKNAKTQNNKYGWNDNNSSWVIRKIL